MAIQRTNLHIFLLYPKPELKIFFFKNLKSRKIGMPRKMTPKSQAKNKPYFYNTHF